MTETVANLWSHPIAVLLTLALLSPAVSPAPCRPTKAMEKGQVETIEIFAGNRCNPTGIYLAAGPYKLTSCGQWTDSSIPCGPNGIDDKEFHFGEIAHWLGTLLGYLEQCYKYITGTDRADFVGTRRHENYPWCSLVGAVAADAHKPGDNETLQPHKTFLIGELYFLNLTEPGYLHAYVNDAWHFYCNNRGSLKLSITRLS